ncbi:MAG: cytochrome c [Paracoccaceae bacterium]
MTHSDTFCVMKTRLTLSALTAFAVASAALAHSGVKNPAVKARMDVMSAIAGNMKTLGMMVKGATPYDVTTAQGAAQDLARNSAQVIALFEAQESDPKSEARPEIWTNWPDFRDKTDAMTQAARSLAQITDEAAFKAAFSDLGRTCTACHEPYRIDKN